MAEVRQRALLGVDMARERRLWARERAELLRGSPPCTVGARIDQVIPAEACTRIATEVHHRRLIKQGGNLRTPANHALCCLRCHRAIHAHPESARGLGLIVAEGDPEWDELGYGADR